MDLPLIALLFALALLSVGLLMAGAAGGAPQEHPFLICTADQFEALRRRGAEEPWATMKQAALDAASADFEAPEEDDRTANRLQSYFGAVALAYIVDPDGRGAYAGRVHDAIVDHLATLEFNEAKRHIGVVRPGSAAFTGIIALDIVQPDLAGAQIEACESVIDKQLSRIKPRGAWPLARYGLKGTWEVYKGERTEPDDRYLRELLSQMTRDGVATTAMSYAATRFGSGDSRPQKTGYIDVLEFTGIDTRYYDHPRLQRFYAWLYGSSVTPDRDVHWFGDMFADRLARGALLFRAGRFGEEAGRYATWALADRTPPGHVLAYVLMNKAYEPKVPVSRLYEDGGAFFREPWDTREALAAAMYNITGQPGWHAHQETNAVSLVAHGTQLLTNGGWLGETTRPAELQNTLSINGKPHAQRTGRGLIEGVTSRGLDYAAGHSGEALPIEGHFIRSLLLVHSQDEVGGYFATFDEVHAQPGDKVHHYLQPSTETRPEEVAAKRAYEAVVDLFTDTPGVRFSVFYGNEPDAVGRELVPSGSTRRKVADHYRLEAVFPTDDQGRAALITLVVPHGKQRRPVEFNRVADDGAAGATLGWPGGVTDYLYASDGGRAHDVAPKVRFQGRAACYRVIGSETRFYFLRHGTQFRSKSVGVAANKPITIHMRGGTGRISSDEATRVAFHAPGIGGVRCRGADRETLDTGDGWVEVLIPAGDNQSIELH